MDRSLDGEDGIEISSNASSSVEDDSDSDYIPSDEDNCNTGIMNEDMDNKITGTQREGRVCSSCKYPLRGHPLPRGKSCQRKSKVFTYCKKRPDVMNFYSERNRNMLTCACCGRLSALKEVREVHLYSHVQASNIIHGESLFLAKMFKCLEYKETIREGLREFYDISTKYGLRYSTLSNMPLDYRGVVLNGSECDVILRFCNDCISSINVGNGKPPWAAYRNGWVTGVAPTKFQSMSAAEVKMLRLGDLNFSTMHIAGRQNGILSSHIVTRMSKYPRERSLPRNLDQSDLKVIFTNANLEDMKQLHKKWIRVRKELFSDAVQHWRVNSAAYADISEKEWNLPENGILEGLVSDEKDNGDLLKNIWKSNDRVAGGDQVFESCVMHLDLSEEVMLSLPNPKSKYAIDNLRRFLISSKGEFADNKDRYFFSKTFPMRFPYGCGTPNCNRQVRVSRERAYQRYLMLADRSFAQDYEFLMYCLDELARKKLHTSIYLQLKQNPSLCDEALQLSTADVEQALQLSASRNYQFKRGNFDVEKQADGVEKALKILGVIQRGASHSILTKEERLKMKRFSDSYCDAFSMPSGMVTWTPKDNTSSWIACFSGQLNGVNYEIIKDWKDPNFPTQKEIRRAASKDPVLSAVAFQKFIDEYVIPILFGWDIERGCSYEEGGEIGKVRAFLIPIEAQGALTSTLHAHALVWLEDFPRTMKEERNNYMDNVKVCNYADKILFGSYPMLEIFRTTKENDVVKCPCCVNGNIAAVDIPFMCKTSLATHWPVVGQCDTCGSKFTSRELRKKYMEILTKHISIDCDISITELYDTVEKILSADCLFPLPEPLPKYMPITKKAEFVTKIREMIVYHTVQNGCEKPILNNTDSSYILSVIYLDIAVEITHEHRAQVSCLIVYLYMYIMIFIILYALFSIIEVVSKKAT